MGELCDSFKRMGAKEIDTNNIQPGQIIVCHVPRQEDGEEPSHKPRPFFVTAIYRRTHEPDSIVAIEGFKITTSKRRLKLPSNCKVTLGKFRESTIVTNKVITIRNVPAYFPDGCVLVQGFKRFLWRDVIKKREQAIRDNAIGYTGMDSIPAHWRREGMKVEYTDPSIAASIAPSNFVRNMAYI